MPDSPVQMSSAVRPNGRLCMCILATLVFVGFPFTSSGQMDPGLLVNLFDSADQGNKDAQYELGTMYEEGRVVQQSLDEAAWWYRLAAEQDSAPAQYKLGTLYHQGKGVEQDYAKAANWYRKAAEKGVPEAQYNLGVIYYSGEGLAADHREAFRWFQKAAKLGVASAQHQLAIMYANGEGTPADFDKAVSWLRKSAAQGHEKSVRLLLRMGIPLKENSGRLDSPKSSQSP